MQGLASVNVEIYSIDGKLVYSRVYRDSGNISFTSLLDSGIYLVKICDGYRVITQKLIVK